MMVAVALTLAIFAATLEGVVPMITAMSIEFAAHLFIEVGSRA